MGQAHRAAMAQAAAAEDSKPAAEHQPTMEAQPQPAPQHDSQRSGEGTTANVDSAQTWERQTIIYEMLLPRVEEYQKELMAKIKCTFLNMGTQELKGLAKSEQLLLHHVDTCMIDMVDQHDAKEVIRGA